MRSVDLFPRMQNERIFPGLVWSSATMSGSVGAGDLSTWLKSDVGASRGQAASKTVTDRQIEANYVCVILLPDLPASSPWV